VPDAQDLPDPGFRVFRWVLVVNIDHASEIRRDGVTRPTTKQELVGCWSVPPASAMQRIR